MNWISDYHIELFKILPERRNETNDTNAMIIKIAMLEIVDDFIEM